MPIPRHLRYAASTLAALGVTLLSGGSVASAVPAGTYLGGFSKLTTLNSTVPFNKDVNPYGLVTVPKSTGKLVGGDLLVSNFNNHKNLQGTGTTIDQFTRSGHRSLFAHISATGLPGPCPGGIGLTTALVALRSGFVVVGSLPTTNGMSATAKAGCLLILNADGHVVETLHGGAINGPWDMTAVDNGKTATLFVTNVLNGTVAAHGKVVHKGTVARIGLRLTGGLPAVTSTKVVGTGFAEKTDPSALVIGPTGVGLGSSGTLFVADTVTNRIVRISGAMHRTSAVHAGHGTVSKGGGLNAPLGLSIAPDGDIITVNGGDGNVVETTPSGHQVAKKLLDKAGAGVLFGVDATSRGMFFVDDGDNTLRLFH